MSTLATVGIAFALATNLVTVVGGVVTVVRKLGAFETRTEVALARLDERVAAIEPIGKRRARTEP